MVNLLPFVRSPEKPARRLDFGSGESAIEVAATEKYGPNTSLQGLFCLTAQSAGRARTSDGRHRSCVELRLNSFGVVSRQVSKFIIAERLNGNVTLPH